MMVILLVIGHIYDMSDENLKKYKFNLIIYFIKLALMLFEEKSKINKKKDFKHFLYVLDSCAEEVSVPRQMIIALFAFIGFGF